MREQDLTNKEIYRMGNKALGAIRLPEEEIESIVNSPRLFDAIKAAVDSGPVQSQPQHSVMSWQILSGFDLRKALAMCGGFILLTAALTGFIFLEKQHNSLRVAIDVEQEIVPSQFPQPEPSAVDLIEPQKPNESVRLSREPRAMRTRAMKKTLGEKGEEVGEFVAVSYADDLEESKANGQLVRVQLPRSSLVAMGVNIPAGNEAETFKTDLLLGEDGVMRAIRLIN